ncbi:hypothetical protein LEMLEM_LOCUS5611 [Lemmus lemmus]
MFSLSQMGDCGRLVPSHSFESELLEAVKEHSRPRVRAVTVETSAGLHSTQSLMVSAVVPSLAAWWTHNHSCGATNRKYETDYEGAGEVPTGSVRRTTDAEASGRKREVKMAEISSEEPGKTLTALGRELGVAA